MYARIHIPVAAAAISPVEAAIARRGADQEVIIT
jgi:hypothetical protein